MSHPVYETIAVETPAPGVGLVRFNRPQALNALNAQMTGEAFTALEIFDRDPSIGCMILTGGDRAFAAGADIKEMSGKTSVDMFAGVDVTDWSRLTRIAKPVIAAVSGFAFGGGCEIAMTCDMIVASETAQFGQPEINLGVIPGAGGTQRLTRAVGKALAMEIVLTDRRLTAEEALRYGLVNRVAPDADLDEAVASLTSAICSKSPVAIRTGKAMFGRQRSMSLEEAYSYAGHVMACNMMAEDAAEGIDAFIEKRKPQWKGR